MKLVVVYPVYIYPWSSTGDLTLLYSTWSYVSNLSSRSRLQRPMLLLFFLLCCPCIYSAPLHGTVPHHSNAPHRTTPHHTANLRARIKLDRENGEEVRPNILSVADASQK